tara:strand:+ start:799 stop:1770 length:972 start_codon:yes stop_codon:yes gene_type:complete
MELKISPLLLQLIYGLVMSDGSLRLRNVNGNATFSLVSKHKLFVTKICNIFLMHGIMGSVRKHNPGKSMMEKGKVSWRYESRVAGKFFTRLHKKWYRNVNGHWIKHIPKIKALTPTTLAYCMMGDGHNQEENARSQRIFLCLESFGRRELEYLVSKLRKVGLEHAYVERTRDGQTNGEIDHNKIHYRVVIGVASDVIKIIDLISPIILSNYEKEFGYKLKRPNLIRQKFTRLKTKDLKILEQTDPTRAAELHNKKINKHRREDYDADVDKKQQSVDRAHRSYQIQLIVKQDLIDLALNEEPGDDAKITKFFSQFSSLTKLQWL